MKLPDLIRNLFSEENETRFAVRHYCMSCVALRLLGIGFEPQINAFTARELMMLGVLMPAHARDAIFQDAYARAKLEGDERVLALFVRKEAA